MIEGVAFFSHGQCGLLVVCVGVVKNNEKGPRAFSFSPLKMQKNTVKKLYPIRIRQKFVHLLIGDLTIAEIEK